MDTPGVIYKLDLKCGAPFVHLLVVRLSSMKNISIIEIHYPPRTLNSSSGWERSLYHSRIQSCYPGKRECDLRVTTSRNMIPFFPRIKSNWICAQCAWLKGHHLENQTQVERDTCTDIPR